MTRAACLGLPFLALVSVCFAGHPTDRYIITIGKNDQRVDYLAVDRGRLVLVASRFSRPDTLDRPGADRWYVMGTKIKSTEGGYLAYDPAGKDNKVILAPKSDADGTEWVIRRPKGVFKPRNGHGSGDYQWGVLQAASGPMKDWYVDVEEVEEKNDDGKTVKSHRFILSKEPSWNVEVMRIYR